MRHPINIPNIKPQPAINSQQQRHCNKKRNVFFFFFNHVNGVFILNFIVNFKYSGVFTVNFEHISHLARRGKCQNMCFILEKRKKSLTDCKVKCFVFFLPNISKPHPPSPEYRPIKFILCPYIRPGRINEILRYLFSSII